LQTVTGTAPQRSGNAVRAQRQSGVFPERSPRVRAGDERDQEQVFEIAEFLSQKTGDNRTEQVDGP
jgi:hypothetical protein